MSISLIWQYLPQLLQGLWLTVLLVISALLLGVLLAALMTAVLETCSTYLQWPVHAFIFFIRGTPSLVQFYLIYYGSGQFTWLHESFLWPIFKQPFGCALVALSINTAAYSTALLQGALQAVPKGAVEAARALGLSHGQTWRRIIFPSAFRIVLPAYSNEVILVLKGSSLASTIALLELTGVTKRIISQTYASMTFYLVAGALYLALNLIIVGVFRQVERRFPR